MKQLLHHFRNERHCSSCNNDNDNDTSNRSSRSDYFVVALHDRAFVGRCGGCSDDDDNDNFLFELQKPVLEVTAAAAANTTTTTTTQKNKQTPTGNQPPPPAATATTDDDKTAAAAGAAVAAASSQSAKVNGGTKKTSSNYIFTRHEEAKDENNDKVQHDTAAVDPDEAKMMDRDDDDNENDDNENVETVEQQRTPARTTANVKQRQPDINNMLHVVVDPWQIQAVVGTIDYFPQQHHQHQQHQQHAEPSLAAAATKAVEPPPQGTPPLAIIVAVAYYNKTLAIYRIELSSSDLDWMLLRELGGSHARPAAAAAAAAATTANSSNMAERRCIHQFVAPVTVYHTTKRVSSLCFARVPPPPPPPSSSSSSPLQNQQQQQQDEHEHGIAVVITGDLAGDAFAYSLTDKDHQYHHHPDVVVSTTTSSNSNHSGQGGGDGGDGDGQDDDSHHGNDVDPKPATTTLKARAVALKESPEEEVTCCSFRRLLLGHTASMLTAVECCSCSTSRSSTNNLKKEEVSSLLLLTADRDEKIRVSSFPNTHEIHGFLLGHSAFVSSMTVVKNTNNTSNSSSSGSAADNHNKESKKKNDYAMNIVVSCGCDCTLRVWDFQQCIELVSLSLNNDNLQGFGIPIKVAAVWASTDDDADDDKRKSNALPRRLLLNVIVIYDDSKHMHVFQVSLPFDRCNSSNGYNAKTTSTGTAAAATIREVVQISLPAQPLAISMLSSSQVLVLMRDPEYLRVYNILTTAETDVTVNGSSCTFPTAGSGNPACRLLQDVAQAASLKLADTVLEKDKFGNYKMQKNNEKRGPAHELPWNNVSRRETAREQTRRSRKNRKSRKRQKTNSSNEMDQNAMNSNDDGDDKES
jgi:hypothetical protein